MASLSIKKKKSIVMNKGGSSKVVLFCWDPYKRLNESVVYSGEAFNGIIQ